MDDYGIESSKAVKMKYIKIMPWGATGTRKTEFVLRNFPDVCVADAEGNTDQCVDMDEIPEFLRKKTKDVREVIKIIQNIKAGKIKFADGRPVRTLSVDSASVFWGVQQNVAYARGEARAKSRGGSDGAQQLDWVAAKRPLKELYLELAGSSIEFFILIAREKDEYQSDDDKAAHKPKRMLPDVVKNTEYEMNLALHFGYDESKKWYADVTKVQGGLGKFFPQDKRLYEIPFAKLFAYAKKIDKKVEEPVERSEDDIATEIAADTFEHTSKGLIAYGKEKGVTAKDIGVALKAENITGFDPGRWGDMVKAVDDFIAERAIPVPAE